MSAKETIGDFAVEVDVKDRRITAVHREYGHRYWSTWQQSRLTLARCNTTKINKQIVPPLDLSRMPSKPCFASSETAG